jgi:Skp family chaperone for outer membrane proteins
VLKQRGTLENNLEDTKKKFVDTINSLEKDVDNLKVQYNDDFLEEEANNQIELLD